LFTVLFLIILSILFAKASSMGIVFSVFLLRRKSRFKHLLHQQLFHLRKTLLLLSLFVCVFQSPEKENNLTPMALSKTPVVALMAVIFIFTVVSLIRVAHAQAAEAPAPTPTSPAASVSP
jgi:hypothetical protein